MLLPPPDSSGGGITQLGLMRFVHGKARTERESGTERNEESRERIVTIGEESSGMDKL